MLTKSKNAYCDVSPRGGLRNLSKLLARVRMSICKMTFCDASHGIGFRNMLKATADAHIAIRKIHNGETIQNRQRSKLGLQFASKRADNMSTLRKVT